MFILWETSCDLQWFGWWRPTLWCSIISLLGFHRVNEIVKYVDGYLEYWWDRTLKVSISTQDVAVYSCYLYRTQTITRYCVSIARDIEQVYWRTSSRNTACRAKCFIANTEGTKIVRVNIDRIPLKVIEKRRKPVKFHRQIEKDHENSEQWFV